MIIAPNIEGTADSGGYITSAFSDGDRLYLMLNVKLDIDLPPLPNDLSLVSEHALISVLSLNIEDAADGSVLALLLEQPISVEQSYELKYMPTQWLMCAEGVGDSIEAFAEKIYPKPSDALDPGLRLKSNFDVSSHNKLADDLTNRKEVNATIRCASEFRIELGFDRELSTTVALNPNEFRAELQDRWLKITSVKYVKPHSKAAPEIYIELSEPMEEGNKVLVAYRSPIGRIKTVDEEAITNFTVEAVVENDQYAILDAEFDSDITVNDESLHDSLETSKSSDEVLTSIALVSDDLPEETLGDYHENTLPLQNEIEQGDQLPLDTAGVAAEQSDGGLEPAFTILESDIELESESASVDLLHEDHAKDSAEGLIVDDSDDSADIVIGMDDALTEFDEAIGQDSSSTESRQKSKPSSRVSKHESLDTKLKSKTTPNAPVQPPLSLAAKLIYVVPIAIFCWLLFIICIYIATIAFDIDLNISSLFSKQSKSAHVVETCTLKSSDGSVYNGECKNRMRNGQGVYTWVSGNRYEGTWLAGKRHGKGKLIHASGAVYDGDFSEDLEHGRGVMRWPNGASYEGEYSHGKFHGIGVYLSAQGNRYEGIFENGSMTSNGDCTMKSGEKYAGPCKSK